MAKHHSDGTLKALAAADVLRLWERGDYQSPAATALAILAAASDAEQASWAEASIGARDAALLQLRARTFGPTLQARTDCPACGERLEFALAVADLLAPRAGHDHCRTEWYELQCADWQIRFRLPCSLDLIGLEAGPAGADRRQALLARCVGEARCADLSLAADALPPQVVAALAERMEALDPCADILLALTCANCQHAWHAPFDIVSYLRSELAVHAQRLLREVDVLARAYGWREADILALSSARRRAYLELCSA